MSADRMWCFDPDADRYDWEHPRDSRPYFDAEADEDEDDAELDTLPDPRCTVCGYPVSADSHATLCDDCRDNESATYRPLREVME